MKMLYAFLLSTFIAFACQPAGADDLLPSTHFSGLPSCTLTRPVKMPKHIFALPEHPSGEVRIAVSFSPEGKIVERVILKSYPEGIYDEASISAIEWLNVKSDVGTNRFRHCQMEVVFTYEPFRK